MHGYPWRYYRDPDSGENTRIRILSILCPIARAAGRSYTKRLLPDFLIPRCVVRLDCLVEAAAEHQSRRDIARSCELLGCIDVRTARVHLKRLKEAIEVASVELAEARAMSPELGELSHTTPETLPLARLEALYRRESEAGVRAGAGSLPITLRQILQAVLWKPPGNKPSACASASPRGP